MKNTDINYRIAGFSVIDELAHGIINAATGCFDRTRGAQTDARLEPHRKQKMQNETQQEVIDGLSLE